MTPRGSALFAVVCALSGSAYLWMKLAVATVPAPLVAEGRVAVGAAILLPIAARRGELPALRRRWRALLALALLEFAVPFTLVTAGSKSIASSFVGVLMAAGPILTVLVARAYVPGEAARGRAQPAGLALGLAGVALLLGVEVQGAEDALGAALVLGGCLAFAGGGLVLHREFAAEPVAGVVGTGLGLSALLLLGPALLSLPGTDASTRSLVATGVLGVGYGALNFTLFGLLVAAAGAARAAVTAYVAPVVSVLFGVLVLGEHPGAGLLLGLPLVLAGSWLATRRAVSPA